MVKFIVVALFIVGAIVVIMLQKESYEHFMENAGEVMGIIEKKETRIDSSHSMRGKSENILIYRYSVDGKEYHGEDLVEYSDLWAVARDGMSLRVYYSKSNPSKSYPATVIDRRLKIAEKMK